MAARSGGGRNPPAAPAPEGRERMIASAAQLFGARGVDATPFSTILSSSRAPRGSIYYYFPAGKGQLVEAAVRWTTDQVLAYQRACTARSPAGILTHFVDFFRTSLVSSQCRAGCPVAAVALGTYSGEDVLGRTVRESFRSWISLLSGQLRRTGLAPRSARELAITSLAAVEGALILCRAEGRVEPLDTVRRELRGWASERSRP